MTYSLRLGGPGLCSGGCNPAERQVADWLNQQPDSTGVVIATTQAAILQPYLHDGPAAAEPEQAGPDALLLVMLPPHR